MICTCMMKLAADCGDAEFVLIASDGSELTTTTDANGQATAAGLYGGGIV